jgi:predicted DNA-binding transcriptional regulator YafY
MDIENSRKIKLLKLWEILNTETDEDHPISTVELIKRLGEEGIPVDRKILYKDIKLLQDNGYDIKCDKQRSNKYYVCFRAFDASEIRVLIDAVQASRFLSPRITKDIVGRLAALAGSRKGLAMQNHTADITSVKTTNEKVIYAVDAIEEALEKGVKIKFNYFDYNTEREPVYRMNGSEKKVYEASPIATVFDDDKYYLICFHDKYKGPTNYRIDRMANVTVTDEPISRKADIKSFDVEKYKSQLFGMYSGDSKAVTFVAEKELIDVIFDKFGSEVTVSPTLDGKLRCKARVQIGPVFVAWLCSFEDKIKVIDPPSVVKKIKENLNKILDQYE